MFFFIKIKVYITHLSLIIYSFYLKKSRKVENIIFDFYTVFAINNWLKSGKSILFLVVSL